jgi:TonB-linked SusC/RagA family outer membrane protein
MKLNTFKCGMLRLWLPPKILLIMKMIIIIMTTLLTQISASGLAQRITLNEKGASLESVIQKIRIQTGYDFVYEYNLINNAKKVDLHLNNTSLEDALDKLFKDQKLSYSIKDKVIVLDAKEPSFLDNLVARFVNINVSGRVVDSEGKPLPGATVTLKQGSTVKAVYYTLQDGKFFFRNVEERSIIIVSYIGYATKEIAVKEKLGDIVLKEQNSELDEVVINKGYYTETKRLSTGSVGRITAEDIGKQPVSNPLAALYGRVPGLVITQQSGIPGGAFEIQIRGQNSLRRSQNDNGNIPLYLIDGMPFNSTSMTPNALPNMYPTTAGAPGSSPFNNINPADIESIEILKDADATAIYGSRGANGVVLITTKRGKPGEMKVDANFYMGAGKVTRMMKLLNTEQYLEMRKEAFKNDGVTIYPVSAYDVNGTWDQNKYTDWQKELIGGTAQAIDGQISISGGTFNTQYRFGGGYHKEDAVFPGDFSDRRGSFHLNLNNNSPNQKFKSQVTVGYSVGMTNLFSQDLTSGALTYAPNAPDLLDADGNLNWPVGVTQNHLQHTKKPYNAKNNNLMVSSNFSYEITNGLILKTSMGYTNISRKEISKDPVSSYLPSIQQFLTNSSFFGNTSNNSWIIEPQLDWNIRFNKNSIRILIGSTFQDQNTESLYQSATGIASEALMDNISAATNANVSNTYSIAKYRYNAIFTRVNYTYNGKYLINLTGRRDGSSRFGPNRQLANFGAIGAAWVFSEEKIIQNSVPFLSFGKLRSSYGITGSDQTPNYGFLDLYRSSASYGGISGLAPVQLFNPDFGWEENKKLEIALEVGFLKDRILFTTAWYSNRSSDQLIGYPLPPTTGFRSVPYNLDATVQNKGLEFELSTKNIKTSTFSWNSSFNLSLPKNKLVSYPNIAGSSYSNQYVVGEPLSIVKLYRSKGVNPQTGLYEVQDVDNNNIYNALDQQVIKFIGTKFNGGFYNQLQWNRFEFDFLFQYSKQLGRNYLSWGQPPGNMNNQPIEVLNRWTAIDDVEPMQKFQQTSSTTFGRNGASDASLTDASFIRLRNLSISYLLPSSFLRKIGDKNLKIYLQGQNLFTITNYKGLDPESQGMALPPLRVLTAGIQLTL